MTYWSKVFGGWAVGLGIAILLGVAVPTMNPVLGFAVGFFLGTLGLLFGALWAGR